MGDEAIKERVEIVEKRVDKLEDRLCDVDRAFREDLKQLRIEVSERIDRIEEKISSEFKSVNNKLDGVIIRSLSSWPPHAIYIILGSFTIIGALIGFVAYVIK